MTISRKDEGNAPPWRVRLTVPRCRTNVPAFKETSKPFCPQCQYLLRAFGSDALAACDFVRSHVALGPHEPFQCADRPAGRGGSVCLNSSVRWAKWSPAGFQAAAACGSRVK